jgi:hypothetical protein
METPIGSDFIVIPHFVTGNLQAATFIAALALPALLRPTTIGVSRRYRHPHLGVIVEIFFRA